MNRMTMKDIPADDRPYEKCLRTGPEGLSVGELLSLIIRTGSRADRSLARALKILALYCRGAGGVGAGVPKGLHDLQLSVGESFHSYRSNLLLL